MERAASLRRRLQRVEREDPEVVRQAVLRKMREDLRKMKAERQNAALAHLNRCPRHLSSHQPAKNAVRNAPKREAAITRLEGGCHKTWMCRKKKTRRGTRGRGRRCSSQLSPGKEVDPKTVAAVMRVMHTAVASLLREH